MTMVKDGKNKFQLWRPNGKGYDRVCTLPDKKLSGGTGSELILPIGVRPR